MKKVLIDCDPGIDDALALTLAHGSPELDVVGVTTVGGNVELAHTTDNALRLRDFLGMSAPVARGCGQPLVAEPVNAPAVHGVAGLGEAQLAAAHTELDRRHAVQLIIDTLAAAPGEIALVATGPLTNIALALRTEPRITEWVAEFTIMGGAYTRGNRTPAAEFNILADPDAAAVVFSADWTTTMVGLELTHQARATAAIRERFAGLGRLETELLNPCLDFYGRHPSYRELGPAIHDACAVAHVIDPSLMTTVPARVDVETQGRFTTGMTVTDFGSNDLNALVATELDAERFWATFTTAFRNAERQLPTS